MVLVVKNLSDNAGDTRDTRYMFNPQIGRSLEQKIITNPVFFALENPDGEKD